MDTAMEAVHNRNSRRFKPVNICIYCGSDGGIAGLTNEHVVPLGWEGALILPKSSCRPCATVTAKIEGANLSQTYGAFRSRLKIRTRRKNERIQKVPVRIEYDGRLINAMFPIEEAIIPYIVVRFKQADMFISSKMEGLSFVGSSLESKTISPESQEYWKRYPAHAKFSFESAGILIEDYARMCAKIAHCYATGLFGHGAFHAVLPAEIFGSGDLLPYYVGSSIYDFTQAGNVTNVFDWTIHDGKESSLLVVHFQFFPAFGYPSVSVGVGTLSEVQRGAIVERMNRGEINIDFLTQ